MKFSVKATSGSSNVKAIFSNLPHVTGNFTKKKRPFNFLVTLPQNVKFGDYCLHAQVSGEDFY
jgi:hypothetical protein